MILPILGFATALGLWLGGRRPFASGPSTAFDLARVSGATPRSVDAVPIFRYQLRKDGSYLYHILVRHPGGRIEDPSRIMGMR